MSMQDVARCVGVCVLVSGAAFGLTTQAAETTQTTQGPQCSASRLVGTWERVSLLRNALSVQPPDAPLFVRFGSDGYWSMMEMPDRPKVNKPLEQFAVADYVKSYGGVGAARGTFIVEGNLLTRKHVADIDPTLAGSTDTAQFSVEGETMTLRGSTPSGARTEARFRRLKPQER